MVPNDIIADDIVIRLNWLVPVDETSQITWPPLAALSVMEFAAEIVRLVPVLSIVRLGKVATPSCNILAKRPVQYVFPNETVVLGGKLIVPVMFKSPLQFKLKKFEVPVEETSPFSLQESPAWVSVAMVEIVLFKPSVLNVKPPFDWAVGPDRFTKSVCPKDRFMPLNAICKPAVAVRFA